MRPYIRGPGRAVVVALAGWLLLRPPFAARADNTFVYSVQLSATIQAAPPQVTLSWVSDPYGATKYNIFRKSKDDKEWSGPVASLDGSALGWTDSDVAAGTAYEYQVVKNSALGYTGYGYIYAGIQAPITENRGRLLLVVETNATLTLTDELGRLEQDLTGDGWTVTRLNVSSNDSPESVKGLITGAFWSDPTHVNSVFLFGHVPVLHSGQINYDTHGTRPMPADAYYGDIDDDWPTAPSISPSILPSDVELMVGRVDFFNMPGIGAASRWPGETELLRNYLEKDHSWRHKQIAVPRRALMGNGRGDERGEATASSGYRNFEPLVGHGNTLEANVSYTAPNAERWMSRLESDSYLLAYGCGGGAPNGCGDLGTNIVNKVPGFLYSADVIAGDAKAVFVLLFGSWFGQWDLTDDLMRSFLATKTMGLACMMAGRPHWFIHHMGLGETVGYSTRLNMNNRTLYRSQINDFPRAVYIALMGDPTLRMEPVAPPAAVVADPGQAGIALNWSPSADDVVGYHVYRADDPAGPFTRLSTDLVKGTNYVDTTAQPLATYTYMIRAVTLQTNPSGSYFNPSQGAFTTAQAASAPVPIQLTAGLTTNGLQLTWTTEPGATYRVMAQSTFSSTPWTDLSGPITTTNLSLSWTDPLSLSATNRFYRVVSE